MSESDRTVSLLRNSTIFGDLSDEEMQIVAGYSDYYEFCDNEQIFEHGSEAQELCVIDHGAVVIRGEDEEGADIARFVSGESFGELDLMGGNVRTAAAVAETPTRILLFPRRGLALSSIIHEHPSIFARVLYRLIATVASRIRSTNRLISENAPWVKELRHQIHMDKLTGLYNDAYLSDEIARLLREDSGSVPVAAMMIKPDNFKEVNDTYGHEAGDRTLNLMAQTLQRLVLPGESAVRFRGNELAVLMPATDRERAIERARTVQPAMSSLDLAEIIGTNGFELTVSIGLATSEEAVGGDETAETVVEAAHARAMAARESGGNAVRHKP
ncbi:MAG: GGDEF domain-containing protein [Spirochaetota bacterium]